MTSITDIIDQLYDADVDGLGVKGDRPAWIDKSDLSEAKKVDPEEIPDIFDSNGKSQNTSNKSLNDRSQGILGPNREGKIGGEVENEGADALAFYIPYHEDPAEWGIYIRKYGLAYLTDFLTKNGVSYEKAKRAATRKLRGHEEMHFHIENICTQQEMISRKAVYRPQRDSSPRKYDLEEALANANAVRKFDKGKVKKNIERFCNSKQPRGYSDWDDVSWRKKFRQGIQDYFSMTEKEAEIGPAQWYPHFSWSLDKTGQIPHYLIE